uniref:Tetratricopeptide repeat protein n=1 Tax=candidate division WOR-3 bacterium TaxID=2052148 RepID=A0A7C4CA94_UNCW3
MDTNPDSSRSRRTPEAATNGGPAAAAAELLRTGLQEFHRENEGEALDCFLEVISRSPDNLRAHYLAALCASILGDEDTLEQVCNGALKQGPRHPYAIACDAVRYVNLGNFSRAEYLFELALAALPNESEIHLGLGLLYEAAGDEAKGAEVYRRVLELAPDNVRARVSLGISYALEGEYASALAEYERAKALDPLIENPHQRLGRDYYNDGMIEEAAAEFEVAINEEPDAAGAWFYLMDCRNRLGLTDAAIDAYTEIRRRFDSQPEVTSGYFEFFRMHREAIAALTEMARRFPEDADVQLRLSEARRAAGDAAGAKAAAERALELDPNDPRALMQLAELEFAAGGYEAALELARRTIAASRYEQWPYALAADALVYLGRGEDAEEMMKQMERARGEAWERYQARFSGRPEPPEVDSRSA